MIIDRSDKEIKRERGKRERTEGTIILSAVVTEDPSGLSHLLFSQRPLFRCKVFGAKCC